MNRWIVALVVLLVAVIVAASSTQAKTVLDDDDSEGPLDTVAARHKRYKLHVTTNEGEMVIPGVRFRLITYEAWDSALLAGERDFISFEINRDADPVVERCLVIKGSAEGVTSQLFKHCDYFGDEPVTEPSEAFRRDAHSVEASMGLRLLTGKNRNGYRWRTVTSFEGPDPEGPCPPLGEEPPPPPVGSCLDDTEWITFKVKGKR